MRVRRQDPATGDMTFGQSAANFWIDAPDGVAQVVGTRLGLFTGQWFLDKAAGTPWDTKVLGKYTGATRDLVIKDRVLNTPGVTSITAYSSSLNRDTRAFDVNMTIETAYGTAVVTAPV